MPDHRAYARSFSWQRGETAFLLVTLPDAARNAP
jgi:hypothetical protein